MCGRATLCASRELPPNTQTHELRAPAPVPGVPVTGTARRQPVARQVHAPSQGKSTRRPQRRNPIRRNHTPTSPPPSFHGQRLPTLRSCTYSTLSLKSPYPTASLELYIKICTTRRLQLCETGNKRSAAAERHHCRMTTNIRHNHLLRVFFRKFHAHTWSGSSLGLFRTRPHHGYTCRLTSALLRHKCSPHRLRLHTRQHIQVLTFFDTTSPQ